MITLAWIKGYPSKWKTFIGNRVSIIQENIATINWKYVPTKDNPADCASRGISPQELINHQLWWNGPDWLNKEITEWPKKTTLLIKQLENQ